MGNPLQPLGPSVRITRSGRKLLAPLEEFPLILGSGVPGDSSLAWLPAVRQARQHAIASVKKRHAYLRFALLAGLFAELERATIALPDGAGTTPSVTIPGRRTYRWEVRPTVEIQILDPLSFRFDYYYKQAFSGYRESATGSRKDFRRDLQGRLLAKAPVPSLGTLDFELVYREWFDNSPPFNPDLPAIEARSTHRRIMLRVGASF